MDISKYKLLDQISMILHRPDTFVGAIDAKTISSYIIRDGGQDASWETITYSPALLKLFDEILQNCYDHSKRPEGKHLTKVDININPMTGMISLSDNGGIPVVFHPDYQMHIPCMIFGHLNSSSNYDDSEQREGGGRNGLGSKLTNIFSTFFKVETADGVNKYEKTYEDNLQKQSEPKISASKNKGTKITFHPDYARLNCSLDADNYGMLITRVYEVAACSPHIKMTLNGKPIDVSNFKDFVGKFREDNEDMLFVENTHWRIGVMSSGSDGFKHVSFANAIHTWQGGTHVDYLADQLVEGVRDYIKKKTKQDIKPAELKNHFFLMVDCTVYNPRFSSQTKEHMNLAIKDYGTTFRFDEAFFKKLIKTDIVQDIIEWVINKKKLQDMKDLKSLGKDKTKNTFKMIEGYESASQKNNREECILFICEGDSALNPLLSARDPQKHGIYPLRGKPLNLETAPADRIKKNTEVKDLMAILDLEFDEIATNLRYGKIVLSTDADMDGQHIQALMINNFKAKWPNLLTEGRVCYLRTPIVRITLGKQKMEFFTEQEYEEWQSQNPNKKPQVKFLKGLGGHSTADFKKYMFEEQYIVPFEYDADASRMLGIAFGDAKEKKAWLNCE